MSRLDGVNAMVPKNAVVPCAVVPDNAVVPHEKSRLDERTAGDGNDKALSTPHVLRGDYACISFDGFKGANVSFLNKFTSEPEEEKERVQSDE